MKYYINYVVGMDPFEDKTPVRFTQLLRDKIRAQRGVQRSPNEQEQLKLVAKRNLEIRRALALQKEGLILDYNYHFEEEAELVRRLRLSTDRHLNVLHG